MAHHGLELAARVKWPVHRLNIRARTDDEVGHRGAALALHVTERRRCLVHVLSHMHMVRIVGDFAGKRDRTVGNAHLLTGLVMLVVLAVPYRAEHHESLRAPVLARYWWWRWLWWGRRWHEAVGIRGVVDRVDIAAKAAVLPDSTGVAANSVKVGRAARVGARWVIVAMLDLVLREFTHRLRLVSARQIRRRGRWQRRRWRRRRHRALRRPCQLAAHANGALDVGGSAARVETDRPCIRARAVARVRDIIGASGRGVEAAFQAHLARGVPLKVLAVVSEADSGWHTRVGHRRPGRCWRRLWRGQRRWRRRADALRGALKAVRRVAEVALPEGDRTADARL